MSKPENPPAFPTIGSVAHNSDWQTEHGMTLRDHFAGLALPFAWATAATIGEARGLPSDAIAKACAFGAYSMADAMLAEREVVR